MRWIGVTQSHRQCHHTIEQIRLPVQLCVCLAPFMRYSELFVESRRFPPPPTRHLALCLVVTPGRSNFIKVFGVRKLEPLGYHYHVRY